MRAAAKPTTLLLAIGARREAMPEGAGKIVAEAAGAMTGRRYVASLQDGREVWIDGAKVADVTTHPAFKDMIGSLARVYDLQNSDRYRDEMTFVDGESGVHASL